MYIYIYMYIHTYPGPESWETSRVNAACWCRAAGRT